MEKCEAFMTMSSSWAPAKTLCFASTDLMRRSSRPVGKLMAAQTRMGEPRVLAMAWEMKDGRTQTDWRVLVLESYE